MDVALTSYTSGPTVLKEKVDRIFDCQLENNLGVNSQVGVAITYIESLF
jgi:hypothetical protein